MTKRKRKPLKPRTRQNPGKMDPRSGPGRQAPEPEKAQPSAASQTNTGTESQKPQFEWVAVEHRDADGNPTFPKDLIAGTYRRRYEEVPQGSEIKAHVLAGYKPKPLMLVERKIYKIHRLSFRGWRRSGQITVEVEGWRHHEADWFNAMRGVRLQVSDPALPGTYNEDSDYIVSESSFNRKIVTAPDNQGNPTKIHLHEGTLKITETWKSAWRRQGAEIINLGFKWFFFPLLVAIVAGLVFLWID